MGKRVARTRAGNTWTEARYFSFIRGLLRQGFRRYPVKYQVKNRNRRQREGKRGYDYQCGSCGGWFGGTSVEVDHIEPAGSLRSFADLPNFVEKLFCEEDKLQLLCKSCHLEKTNKERKARRKK